MSSPIKKTIILAAGLGSRLRPLTNEAPKCLTEVNNKSILERSLKILEQNGINETVILIGYLGKAVVDKIGNRYGNMKISYIWNKIYDRTNTMYSLWLAKEYLKKGTLLIEGDCLFEETLLKKLLQTPSNKAYWALDKFREGFDGSMSIADPKGRIVGLKIIREKLKEYKNNYYKSTGVLKITPEYGRVFSKWLDDDVKKGQVNIYYDLVITKHLRDIPICVCDIYGLKWAEIDDFNDFKKAENLFKGET